ncbi:MAG: acyltransferase [Sneathiella sp.]|nr:MAG: acyltransferase [Sneathiella sp.]
MSFTLCAIVPSHNHYLHIVPVIAAIRARKVPVFIIDDGSAEPAKSALAALHDPEHDIIVHRINDNGGKGRAVIQGFRLAIAAGYSHALQVDADGQHDTGALPALIAAATENPSALVSGQPIYDESIPTSRKLARWLTHIWVWIETLSMQITDSMCGYRLYPLAPALAVAEQERVGSHMDFDTEIMVRMSWRGTPVIMIPVKVTYPADNISNFRLVADNWRITKMHTRLVFGMVTRLPRVIRNRPRKQQTPQHWATLTERGAAWGLRLVFGLYRLFGRRLSWYALQPVLLYFFVTGGVQRRAIQDYWRHLYRARGGQQEPTLWQLWLHFRSFGRMALDKVAAWLGDIKVADLTSDNMAELDRVANADTGVVVFTSHLGNVEVLRALSGKRGANRITVFAHTKNAVRFTQMLADYNPASAVDVMEVEDIGPATLIELQNRLQKGDWIVIAGDRIPVSGAKRITHVSFLGELAPFSEGPVIIASLLKCPVYVMNCVREATGFRIFFAQMADRIILPRKNRAAALQAYVDQYAKTLEEICKKYPDQWYNFFDFWAEPKNSGSDE